MVQDENLQQPDGMHYGRQQSSSQPYKSSGKQRPPHHAEPSAQTPMKPAALCASASGSAPPGPASELSPQELGAKIAAAMLARIFGAAERPESSVRRPSLAHGNKMHGPTPRDTHNSPQLVTNPPAKPAESDTKGAGMCSQSDTRPHAAWETRGHTAGQTQQQQQSKHVEAPPASQSKQSNGRGQPGEGSALHQHSSGRPQKLLAPQGKHESGCSRLHIAPLQMVPTKNPGQPVQQDQPSSLGDTAAALGHRSQQGPSRNCRDLAVAPGMNVTLPPSSNKTTAAAPDARPDGHSADRIGCRGGPDGQQIPAAGHGVAAEDMRQQMAHAEGMEAALTKVMSWLQSHCLQDNEPDACLGSDLKALHSQAAMACPDLPSSVNPIQHNHQTEAGIVSPIAALQPWEEPRSSGQQEAHRPLAANDGGVPEDATPACLQRPQQEFAGAVLHEQDKAICSRGPAMHARAAAANDGSCGRTTTTCRSGNDLENGLDRGDGQIAAAGAGWTMALHPDAVQPYKPDAITRRQIAAIQVGSIDSCA